LQHVAGDQLALDDRRGTGLAVLADRCLLAATSAVTVRSGRRMRSRTRGRPSVTGMAATSAGSRTTVHFRERAVSAGIRRLPHGRCRGHVS